jgi:hypothetical protein
VKLVRIPTLIKKNIAPKTLSTLFHNTHNSFSSSSFYHHNTHIVYILPLSIYLSVPIGFFSMGSWRRKWLGLEKETNISTTIDSVGVKWTSHLVTTVKETS